MSKWWKRDIMFAGDDLLMLCLCSSGWVSLWSSSVEKDVSTWVKNVSQFQCYWVWDFLNEILHSFWRHAECGSCWNRFDIDIGHYLFYLVAAKSALVRALLFDISFLMLCHVVQTYGSEVGLTPSTKAIYVSDLGPYSESVSEQESWTRVRPPFTSPVDSASLSCSFSTAPLGGQNTQ